MLAPFRASGAKASSAGLQVFDREFFDPWPLTLCATFCRQDLWDLEEGTETKGQNQRLC
jgi:hypothetical protein